MSPIVHAELSWLAGVRLASRRDWLLVTLAGVVPDADGLSLLLGEEQYSRWHHVVTHGLVSAVAFGALFALLAERRAAVGALAFAAFHLHLLCDLAGSGPDWPLVYLWPFTRQELQWSGQWDLASWQNTGLGLAVTLLVVACAVWLDRTIVELLSQRADRAVVAAVRRRLGR